MFFLITTRIATILISCFCAASLQAAEGKLVFVTAANAKLKTEAKAGSADVIQVERGTQLSVLTESGSWYQVSQGAKTGWISKLFVSTTKPIGQNDLLKENAVTDEQMSRKRSSGYSVSAATRGLSATSRNQRGEKFRSNNQALDELEKKSLKPEEILQFQDEAKNGKGN